MRKAGQASTALNPSRCSKKRGELICSGESPLCFQLVPRHLLAPFPLCAAGSASFQPEGSTEQNKRAWLGTRIPMDSSGWYSLTGNHTVPRKGNQAPLLLFLLIRGKRRDYRVLFLVLQFYELHFISCY